MQFGIQEEAIKFNINVGYVQNLSDCITSDTVRHIQQLTQAEYDALENPDEQTIYIITE